MKLESFLRDVPDFPKPGIMFKDISPLLASPEAMQYAIDAMAEKVTDLNIQRVAGIESRGFLFGTPLALKLGVGFTPIRKPGKLPADSTGVEYALEYGTDRLEIHNDGVTTVDLEGGSDWQPVQLSLADFRASTDQHALQSWAELDQLGFVAYFTTGRGSERKRTGAAQWSDPQPKFRHLHWVKR